MDLELPLRHSQVVLDASLGMEQGAFGHGKVDWSLGASRQWGLFKVGIHYIDSFRSEPGLRSGAALVASLTIAADSEFIPAMIPI